MNMIIIAVVAALCMFMAVALLVFGVGRFVTEWQQRQRLRAVTAHGLKRGSAAEAKPDEQGGPHKLSNIMESLSRLSVPKEGWQADNVRLRFIQAGLRQADAARTYYAVKTILTILVPALLGIVVYYIYQYHDLTMLGLIIFSASAAGYYLPDYALRVMTKNRVDEMREVLPDLLDLLVICTESGLALDQAINRVSHEIARSSRMVAEEFHLVTLEIRAGAGRPDALRNLALRVKLDDLASFASMLVQADKFGTSIAEALRIQSEVMRVRRMQRAEELASQIPTKLLLPLILCVFPVLLLVMLGPAVIQLLGAFESM